MNLGVPEIIIGFVLFFLLIGLVVFTAVALANRRRG